MTKIIWAVHIYKTNTNVVIRLIVAHILYEFVPLHAQVSAVAPE